jgi:hypothetical protein
MSRPAASTKPKISTIHQNCFDHTRVDDDCAAYLDGGLRASKLPSLPSSRHSPLMVVARSLRLPVNVAVNSLCRPVLTLNVTSLPFTSLAIAEPSSLLLEHAVLSGAYCRRSPDRARASRRPSRQRPP